MFIGLQPFHRCRFHLACRTFEGGTTKDRFLAYLREDLLLCLKKGDIVVMDNLWAHHAKGVEELLRSVGTVPLYLPPCSPDFNPIEKMWSKMKAILRKMRVRSQSCLILLSGKPSRLFLLLIAKDGFRVLLTVCICADCSNAG